MLDLSPGVVAENVVDLLTPTNAWSFAWPSAKFQLVRKLRSNVPAEERPLQKVG
jgi:hypothetical protein